jgi:hypothetical protein
VKPSGTPVHIITRIEARLFRKRISQRVVGSRLDFDARGESLWSILISNASWELERVVLSDRHSKDG